MRGKADEYPCKCIDLDLDHDAGVSLGGPAEEDAQQVRSLELEAAVEALRARVLELGGAEAIPEKAATEVAAELPGMLSDATLGQFSVTTVAHLALLPL